MSGETFPTAYFLNTRTTPRTRGGVTIALPAGLRFTVPGRRAGPAASLEIRNWRALARLVREGGVGFADAYRDGDWDSPDLAALVEWGARNRFQSSARAKHAVSTSPGRATSAANVAAHYDLGNDFYRQWLDPTLSYSAALFGREDGDLESAQRAKLRRILDLTGAKPGQHILEIGCGWGGFALLAARERGVRVTAVTLSRAQQDYARRQVAEAGLQDRVEILLRDYRDLTGQYDHAVSIEMFEAVGEADWPVFFHTLRERLAPGGRAALQVITIRPEMFPRYRARMDFIRRFVFPGGMLPPPAALHRGAATAGLRVLADERFGAHYARTLSLWRERFEDAWPRIAPLGFDERFRRLWRLYLAYCEGGFRAGNIDVHQIALARP
ncbi:MAG: cyclopropane-fatty-acyl-phospholipid synthase [Alphaproteobacteria bacterium]|nr:cyclopropane-fatty-acyl-phospholipid synthase [Alphaproteobacteria bacterium]